MSAIIYDFKAIGGTLRRQWLDDWWQPAKPEQQPEGSEPQVGQNEVWRRLVEQLS